MPAQALDPPYAAVDLTASLPLTEAAGQLSQLAVSPAHAECIRAATDDERVRERNRRIAEVFRKLEAGAAIELLKAAGTLALARERSGLRLWFGFLEVTRPGAEVLGQLNGLSSLRRVTLKIASGSWHEPEESQEVNAARPILDMLEEGARLGALDLAIGELPADRRVLGAVHQHLNAWFDQIALRLDEGRDLPDDTLQFITQLAMLEVKLLEKRVSLLAGAIDPYDTRRIARLLPVLSRLDQDIEHMKDVVSRINTYEPFFERSLTIEQALTSTELDKLVKAMSRDTVARSLGRIIEAMRLRPVLSREFAFHVSQLYQIHLLRAKAVTDGRPADLLSIMLQVLEYRQGDTSIALSLEPEIAEAIWPTIAEWGARRPGPDRIETCYQEGRALNLVLPDGVPSLPDQPGTKAGRELTLLDLLHRHIDNDSFILGLLDNPKAISMAGLVALVARDSRSVRVLEKIIRVPSLHTGAANRDVPRLLLANPAHIPISSLRPFIHVRFVSKVDLRRMARRNPDVRPEVSREVARYMETLA